MTRRWAALAGVIVIATLLAFPLREAVHEAIVIPVAYWLWALGLLYRSMSQGIWWLVLIVLVALILAKSLAPPLRPPGKALPSSKPALGQVQTLAGWLNKSSSGIYFKWLIANRLGKLAYQILLQRGNENPRSVFDPLTGPDDWHPSAEIQNYLQSGLHRSFADFPNPRRFFTTPAKTPLDLDMNNAVDFLESQIEDSRL
jgi:hypothetical protein